MASAAALLLAATSPALALSFKSHTLFGGMGSAPDGVAIGDLNGDGAGDLAFVDSGSGELQVSFSGGGGVELGVGTSPSSISIGKLNGDASPDLAIANYGGKNVAVLLAGGMFGFTEATNS